MNKKENFRKRNFLKSEKCDVIEKKQKLMIDFLTPQKIESEIRDINKYENVNNLEFEKEVEGKKQKVGDNKQERCNICDKHVSSSSLSRHLSRHKRNKECKVCNLKFVEKYFNTHKCISTFYCDQCKRKFPSQSKYDLHVKSHSKVRVLLPHFVKCPICDKDIKRNMLRKHEEIHLKGPKVRKEKAVNKCDICDKIYKRKQKLDKHRKTHFKIPTFPCKHCDKSFIYKKLLNEHMKVTHVPEGVDIRSICSVCNKPYKCLKIHMLSHRDEPTKCEICDVTFRNKLTYISHKNHHRRLVKRQATCKIKSRDHYPFKCSSCGDKFRVKWKYIIHCRKHVDHFMFPCPDCEEKTSFMSMADLFTHVSAYHRSVPDTYTQCLRCGEIVKDIDSHIVTAHQNPSFDCELCDKDSFNSSHDLVDHIRRAHLKKRKRKTKRTPSTIMVSRRRPLKNDGSKTMCIMCHSKVYVRDMRKHVQSHQIYRCQLCPKNLLSLQAYLDHKSNHSKQCLPCTICSKRFISHIRLLAHTTMVHQSALSSCTCSKCTIS